MENYGKLVTAYEECEVIDSDLLWEDVKNDFGDFLLKTNPEEKMWYAETSNFSWQNQSGWTFINGRNNSEEFLRMLLPDCACTFRIYYNEETKILSVENFHHDSPTGEWYHCQLVEDCELCGNSVKPKEKLHETDDGMSCQNCYDQN